MLFWFSTSNLTSQITYTIGSTGDFTTISDAYTNCTASTYYTIEIQDDYNQEALPIILGSLPNKSSVNTVTIRPELGVVGLHFLNTGTENDIFSISSATNLIIDGRPGGVGNGNFTIENNQTVKGHALKIEGDCNNLLFNYLTLKGSNQSTSLGYGNTDAGVLMIGESSNGIIEDVTINNCQINQSSGGIPSYLLTSYAETGEISNCTVSNTTFKDASRKYIQLYLNTTAWEITSNSFYQTTAFTPSSGITFAFIRLYEGEDYSITNNYFGGQEKGAGGDPFTINNANSKAHLISIASTVTGSNTINSNHFKNLHFTTINTSSPSFSIVHIAGGNGGYTIGEVGEGNTIGGTSGLNSIQIYDNGGTATASTALFYSATSSSINIGYNQIGGFSLNGSNTAGNYLSFYSSGSGNVTFSNNTIGNSTANNMSDDIARTGPIYMAGRHTSSGALIASNNTVQNFNLTNNSSGALYFIETSKASSVINSSNTIQNITSEREGLTDLFSSSIAGDIEVNSNSLQSITLNGSNSQAYIIDLSSSAGNINCNNNTIGNTSSENIVLNGNSASYGIILSIPTTKTATLNNNTLQNIYSANTGSGNQFFGIYSSGTGSISINETELKQIHSESTYATTAIYGIYQYNTGLNNVISQVRLNDFKIKTTDATATRNIGIYLRGDNTDGVLEKTKIINFSNTALGSPTDYGIYSNGTSSSWIYKNNVIIMDNESNLNSLKLIAIRNNTAGTTEYYHNTIKISGSVSSGSDYSTCVLENATAASTRIANNNIFYNDRNGGTGTHYGFWNVNAAGMSNDYNYLEANTNVWNNVSYANFSDYQTNSSASNSVTGTLTIDALGGVTSGGDGIIENSGLDLFTSAKVTDDLDGNSRDISPWIGAFETAQPLPLQLISFTSKSSNNTNIISWELFSDNELNGYELERTTDGINYDKIGSYLIKMSASGYLQKNEVKDLNFNKSINYYRLKFIYHSQPSTFSNLISIDNSWNNNRKNLLSISNLMGEIVDESYDGVKIYYYDDGSFEKKMICDF